MSTHEVGVKPPPGQASDKPVPKQIHLNPDNRRDQGTIALLQQTQVLFNNCNDLNARLKAVEQRLKEYDDFMVILAGRMLKTCVIFPEKKVAEEPATQPKLCEGGVLEVPTGGLDQVEDFVLKS